MIVKNKLLNFKNAYIYQDTDYFKMSLDSLLLANFVTINLRDKNILDIATGNAPIPMFLTYRTKANIYGVEIQKEVFDLGVKSIIENKMDNQITLINDDAKNILKLRKKDSFYDDKIFSFFGQATHKALELYTKYYEKNKDGDLYEKLIKYISYITKEIN